MQPIWISMQEEDNSEWWILSLYLLVLNVWTVADLNNVFIGTHIYLTIL